MVPVWVCTGSPVALVFTGGVAQNWGGDQECRGGDPEFRVLAFRALAEVGGKETGLEEG